MPQIPNLPPELAKVDGIHMRPPPADLMGPTMDIIGKAVANARFDDDQTHVVTTWVLTTTGINSAVVAKVPGVESLQVIAWGAKKWSTPLEAGIAGVWRF